MNVLLVSVTCRIGSRSPSSEKSLLGSLWLKDMRSLRGILFIGASVSDQKCMVSAGECMFREITEPPKSCESQ